MAHHKERKYQEGGLNAAQLNLQSLGVAAGGSMLGGLAGLFGTGPGAQQEFIDAAGVARDDIQAFYDKAGSGGYDLDLTLDPAYNQLYEMSRMRTPTDPLMRQGATAVGALQQGGERSLLAGINPTTRAMAEGEINLGLADQQREIAGLQTLAGARQNLATQEALSNNAFMRQLGLNQLQQAQASEATALQNVQDMKMARQNALGQFAGGLGSLATLGLMAKHGTKIPKMENGKKFPDLSGDGKTTMKDILMGRGVIPKPKKAEHGMKYGHGGEYMQGGEMKYPGGGMMPEKYPGGGMMHEKFPGGGMMSYQMGGDVLAQIMGAKGGQPPVQGPLPGEPSHSTNPIDMIDKEGNKVGEAMGGEFIISDIQAQEMMQPYMVVKKAIEDEEREPTMEELMDMYKSFDQVLGQPQFQDDKAAMQMT